MELIQTLLVTLVTLGILVTVHEYGHFWVARRCGVKVLRFSIGFGKSLYTWHDRQGTEFCIAVLPLGGYVRMLDEREGEVSPEDLSGAFNRKPPLQRIAVVAAGPLANFALAVVAFWGLFMAGERGYAPVIGEVEPGSVAEMAGLEPGQEVVAVDGDPTPTWQAVNFRLLERIGDTGTIRFAVKYPGSDVIYQSEGHLERWMAGVEEPDLHRGLGIAMYRPAVPPVIDQVLRDSPAERAGLQQGDRILLADGREMARWEDWVEYVRARPGEAIDITYLRDGARRRGSITPETVAGQGQERIGRVGMAVEVPPMPADMVREFERGPVAALGAGVVRTGELVVFTFESIKKMLQGLISPKNLSGPITIARVAGESAKSGLESYISFLALLSVSLGVLNLLPVPALDGGHLVYYTLELLAGRPVPERIQVLSYQVGLFLVLSIMALALYNDIARL